ncbi:MAG: hypothetical protein PHV80_05050, partial [Rugosibacter sp.]|nr:hypothetical protein [Rugosibacter sp.]
AIRNAVRRVALEAEESLEFFKRMCVFLSERQVKIAGATLVKQKSLSLAKLADQLLKISNTKSVMWISQQDRPGVLNWLLEEYPVKGLNASSTPEEAADAYREASGPAHREQMKALADDLHFLSLSWETKVRLHGHLSSFCSDLAIEIRKIKRSKNVRHATEVDGEDSILLRDDKIELYQKNTKVKRLCQFCWRPACTGHGEHCCSRHSQIENPGGYKFAVRNRLRTPELLEAIFEFGMVSCFKITPRCEGYLELEVLRSMQKDWRGAINKGIAQAFVDKLAGNTYHELKPAAEYAMWGGFFDDLCSAFEISMPDDVDYLAIVLPCAIDEVETEKARKAARKKKVINLAEQLSKTGRGWQTRIAMELDISRQRVGAILKIAGFAG